MSRFGDMHNDYLDPDGHLGDVEDEEVSAWHLYRHDAGSENPPVCIDVYYPQDGQDVMGCDMHEWMLENDHYGEHDPDHYEFEGDSQYVAIMPKFEYMPSFGFEWVEVA